MSPFYLILSALKNFYKGAEKDIAVFFNTYAKESFEGIINS